MPAMSLGSSAKATPRASRCPGIEVSYSQDKLNKFTVRTGWGRKLTSTRGEDMDREGKAHFGVYRINRLALIILALVLVAAATYFYNPLSKVSSVVDRYQRSKVQPGVVLEGRDLSGKNAEELRLVVNDLASKFNSEAPQDAAKDPKNIGGVIPEVNGAVVDVEATVKHVLNLKAGEKASFQFSETPAKTKLSDFPNQPVYRGNPAKNGVSFAINVASGTPSVKEVLEILRANNVRATFFVMGEWAEKNPQLLTNIYNQGHEVAVHGYSERLIPAKASKEDLTRDIDKALQVIEGTIKGQVKYYSPHELAINDKVTEVAAQVGLRTVMYTVDTVDWKDPKPADMVAKIVKNAGNGSIILMHPRPNTAKALNDMIAGLEQKGLKIVTVSELLSPSRYPRATTVSR